MKNIYLLIATVPSSLAP